mmetsp:Transcript_889/g.1210  ORF Transcript_889/g.1210 Transcript_889/m.1210 type:complete len:135 (-) Transcript_889:19-423(-)
MLLIQYSIDNHYVIAVTLLVYDKVGGGKGGGTLSLRMFGKIRCGWRWVLTSSAQQSCENSKYPHCLPAHKIRFLRTTQKAAASRVKSWCQAEFAVCSFAKVIVSAAFCTLHLFGRPLLPFYTSHSFHCTKDPLL